MKKGLLIFIGIICALCVGFASCYVCLEKGIVKFNQKIEEKTYEINENKEESGNNIDVNCQNIDLAEYFDGNKITDYDKMFLALDFPREWSNDFISSSNRINGEMYSTNIPLNYKVYYVLNRYFVVYNLQNLISKTIEPEAKIDRGKSGEFGFIFKLKVDTINTLLAKVWKDTKIYNYYQDDLFDFFENIKCDQDICDIQYYTGIKGTNGEYVYLGDGIDYNDTFTISHYALSYYRETTYDENYQSHTNIYNKKGGKLLKGNIPDSELPTDIDVYLTYKNELTRYKYTFDVNGVLLSVEEA